MTSRRRFAAQGYVALGVDLFAGHNKAICMARMFVGTMLGDLNYYGVASLEAALRQLGNDPRSSLGQPVHLLGHRTAPSAPWRRPG